MSRMATTLRLLIVFLLVAAASAQRQPPMARSGCPDRCGEVTVPYPFGIGEGCYRDDRWKGFQLKCDDSGASPPRLTIFDWKYRLGALSLTASEATTYRSARRACYNSTGGFVDGKDEDSYLSLQSSPYLLSSTRNQLVVLGCPTLGYFVDGPGYYISGCMSVCWPPQYSLPGSCTGVACCRSTIPSGLNFSEPHLNHFTSDEDGFSTIAATTTSCQYVFLAETKWFDSQRVIINRTDDFDVPVVLDWAVRNIHNCSTASRNTTDFACRSTHSSCFDVDNGDGYRCNCTTGFHGNPYLDDGCIGKHS